MSRGYNAHEPVHNGWHMHELRLSPDVHCRLLTVFLVWTLMFAFFVIVFRSQLQHNSFTWCTILQREGRGRRRSYCSIRGSLPLSQMTTTMTAKGCRVWEREKERLWTMERPVLGWLTIWEWPLALKVKWLWTLQQKQAERSWNLCQWIPD